MRYLSVCSGIESATVAWHPLGWQPVAFSEIEAFPRRVLAHHYPQVPLHGDFTTIGAKDYPPADLLVGGTPCQDFSIAGLRAGFAGARGNLTLEYLRLAARLRPRWLVWENVPGVLSLDDGNAFGAFLGALAELGYGFAYRILDAQYFGLAQRRARLFVVGYLGDWRRAAAVLFERESLLGHPAPRRQAGEGVACPIAAGSASSGGYRNDADTTDNLITPALDASYGRLQGTSLQDLNHGHGHLVAFGGNNTSGPIDVATACNAHGGGSGRLDFETETFVAHALRADGFDASEDGTGRGTPIISFSVKDHGADAGPLAPTLRAGGFDKSHANGGVMPAIAFDARQSDACVYGDRTGPVDTKQPGPAALLPSMQVRRLTPRECERLQGFQDDYTAVPYGNKVAADGPRYKALGNAMAVPVMAWIGQRIQMVEGL